jgi:hypothetical protein
MLIVEYSQAILLANSDEARARHEPRHDDGCCASMCR